MQIKNKYICDWKMNALLMNLIYQKRLERQFMEIRYWS